MNRTPLFVGVAAIGIYCATQITGCQKAAVEIAPEQPKPAVVRLAFSSLVVGQEFKHEGATYTKTSMAFIRRQTTFDPDPQIGRLPQPSVTAYVDVKNAKGDGRAVHFDAEDAVEVALSKGEYGQE